MPGSVGRIFAVLLAEATLDNAMLRSPFEIVAISCMITTPITPQPFERQSKQVTSKL
jgi:hypothetical protein